MIPRSRAGLVISGGLTGWGQLYRGLGILASRNLLPLPSRRTSWENPRPKSQYGHSNWLPNNKNGSPDADGTNHGGTAPFQKYIICPNSPLVSPEPSRAGNTLGSYNLKLPNSHASTTACYQAFGRRRAKGFISYRLVRHPTAVPWPE